MEIKKITLAETLESSDVKVTVEPSNKGVLDWTIKARVECAVLRACGASDKNIAWGGMIK